MTDTAGYTPLECLLVFQSLATYGTDDADFDRISDLVTNNHIVKNDITYDPQRLTAEALRQLYSRLLREESAAVEAEGDDGGQSKKRKLQSQSIPSPKDAYDHREKLPQLVDRLYAKYREYMIRQIREDEKRYAAIQREIAQIERGEWDAKILEEQRPKTNGKSPPVESQPAPNGNSAKSPTVTKPTAPPRLEKEPSFVHPVLSPRSESRPEGLAISDVLNSQEQVLSPRPVEQARPPPNYPPQRTGSNGPHGPSPLQTQTPSNWKWEPPYGPPQQPQPPYHTGQYPPPQYAQYPQQQFQPPRGSFPSPHGLPPPHPHVPSSPVSQQHVIHLPPPNGIHRPPSSPGMPLDALADLAGQQYRAPSGSPMLQHPPITYPPPFSPHQQSPSGTAIPSNNGPLPGPSQFAPPYPPQQYQYSPAPPAPRVPFVAQPTAALIQSESRPYSSPYHPNQRPPHLAGSGARHSVPQTPLMRKLPPFTTGSGTRWTQNPTASTPRQHAPINSPAVEPLSPILRPARIEHPKTSPSKSTSKADGKSKTPLRGMQKRQAGSPASSVLGDLQRSQSIMSHADDRSVDAESQSRHVKQEVATPRGVEDGGDTTADEQPRLPTRSELSPRRVNKRKRVSSVPIETRQPSAPPTHVLWTRAFPKISASALGSIDGHKNASLFTYPVKERDAPGYRKLILRPQDLKSIKAAISTGHRAATAAAPREDMANNSTSLWLSISEDLIPPKGIINYAQLEKELMRIFANAVMFNADPDRGIGRWRFGDGKERGDNVGYEIDEDGMVKDTRAMFADVDTIISSLRSAERRSEEMRESSMARATVENDEADEEVRDDESHAGNAGTAKRRRKG